MRKIIIFCGILSVFIFSASATFAKIEVPGRTDSWVNDYADIIDEATEEYIENLVNSIGQKTPDPIEIIIATFKSTEGWNFRDFATEYGKKWREIKRGRKDNGVVLLVVLDEKRVALGAGQNIKGVITDPVVNDIINNIIVPEFSEGRYAEGIKKGTEAVVNILSEADIPMGNPLLTMKSILIAAVFILGFFLVRRLRR